MKRGILAVLVLAIAAVVFYEFAVVAVCDGSYEVSIELAPETAAGVSQISYLCVNRRELADHVVDSIDEYLPIMDQAELPAPFAIQVKHSYRASPFGRTWGHVQAESDIVLVLVHDTGVRNIHRLPLPNRLSSSSIIVTPRTLQRSIE